ncbi:MAG: hypothetical protein AB8B80_09960 [Marinicellaceae bacterium]
MSLVKCPACQKQISNKSSACPHCHYSLNQSKDDLQRQKVINFRLYREKMYRIKMLTFTAMAIAIVGLVPMLWAYAQAIDYGFNANILNHWGLYFVIAGFVMYVGLRVKMFVTKKNYNARK